MNCTEFLFNLQQSGWIVEKNEIQPLQVKDIPIPKLRRAGNEFEELITSFFACHNQTDDVWFLSWADFMGKTDSSFLWNEFELQSTGAAMDESQKKQVTNFWSKHIPFLISVRSGYAYIAMSIEDATFGEIVIGNEPEFEEINILSKSLQEFFDLFLHCLSGKICDFRLAQFT